jgi:hypothetical protein
VPGSAVLDQLPGVSVQWWVTDPAGPEQHRGRSCLGGRVDLLVPAIEELLGGLYGQVHRAADGGVPEDWLVRRQPPAASAGGRGVTRPGWPVG